MSNNNDNITSFEWKIDDFTGKSQFRSQIFIIDFCSCYVVASSCCENFEKFWLFRLDVPGIRYRGDGEGDGFYPVYYTMSIVDCEGHDFIEVRGKMEGEIWQKTGILTIIYESYLKHYNLIKTGSLELRFTFERRKESAEDFTLTECGVQVEASELQTSRDIFTNTECGVQVEASELQPLRDICTNTEEEPGTLLETLSNDFSSFYESKTDTDCVLRVKEEEFPVHRAVLSARSTVFSAMFHHDMAENRNGVVDIPDINATALGDTLYYMYSGKIRGLTAETASTIYTVADKYALIELRKQCLDFLRCNLTIGNVCDAALLAHTHGEADLEERVLHFIEHRLEDIIESSQWKEFSTVKPLLATRLLGSAFISCKKKLLVNEKTLK